MLLNLLRDEDYHKLPSFSYEEAKEAKDKDVTFYELKELKKELTEQGVGGHAMLNNPDFINDYG
jgi:hypothetical protein